MNVVTCQVRGVYRARSPEDALRAAGWTEYHGKLLIARRVLAPRFTVFGDNDNECEVFDNLHDALLCADRFALVGDLGTDVDVWATDEDGTLGACIYRECVL